MCRTWASTPGIHRERCLAGGRLDIITSGTFLNGNGVRSNEIAKESDSREQHYVLVKETRRLLRQFYAMTPNLRSPTVKKSDFENAILILSSP